MKIANATGGSCKELDINSSNGAKMLTDLVTMEILRNVGGELLVSAYQKRYK